MIYQCLREQFEMMEYSSRDAMSRRKLLRSVAIAGALPALSRSEPSGNLKICVFSKHFQWTGVKETAAIANDLGFDGVDLTVRKGGHVLPERVESDLPAAVEIVRGAGLEVPMITTDITDAATPHIAAVLRTANRLGIRQYRWGGLSYQPNKGIPEQLNELKPRMRALADLNKEHQVCGMYHTHSGPGLVGAPIWDLWTIFQGLDPNWMGINYDIGHATVEGGYGGWIASSRLVKDFMRGIALKDFKWAQNQHSTTHHDPFDKSLDAEGAWVPHWCATGQGMVNLPGFFAIVKANRFSGPVQLHFEYPGLGGAENGDNKLRIPKQELITAMRRDLTVVRSAMHAQQLIA
jgi:L-ribulose-5-phosphate 3-epimerase